MKRTFIIAIIALFVVLSLVFFWLRTAAPDYNYVVLMSGNSVMAVLSIISFFLVINQMSKKPDAFVRGVYASSFMKLSVCIFAVLIYVIVNKPDIHKPSLFVLFGIYAAYSIVETWLLSRLARQAK